MSPNEFVVVDVETTGFRPNEGHCIIEIAAEKIRTNQVADTYHSLVLTDRTIDEESEGVHGITNALLREQGRPIADVMPEFVRFIGTLPMVGHNIGFDLAFINTHLHRLHLPLLTNPILDTCDLARRYLIIPSYSLEKVATYLRVPQPDAHRALVDVATTRGVFFKLAERIISRGGSLEPVPVKPSLSIDRLAPEERRGPVPTSDGPPPRPAPRLF